MKKTIKQASKIFGISVLVASLSACGTLTGIPSHGGGKRFAIEQRLVSASIRSTLMDIDVSALRGQRVAVIYDLVSDEGGGQISGGRMNILGAATAGYLLSPVTATNSAFQIFNLTDSGSNYNNTGTGQSQNTASTTNIVSNTQGTQNATQNIGATSGTSTGTSSTTLNNPSVTTTSSTNPVTTTSTVTSGDSQTTVNSGASTSTTTVTPGTTTTTTGSVVTTQTTTPETSTTNTGANTTTQTTTTQPTTSTTTTGATSSTQTTAANVGTSNTTSSGTASTNASVNTSTGTTAETGTQTHNTTANQNTNTAQNSTGGDTRHRQDISPQPVYSTQQTKGLQQTRSATIQYQGLGEYTNFNVPKSDASLLMGLVRTYLLLNGVEVTVPTDPNATAILYVSVDVFGIVRSRFDAYVYNQESVLADTAIEMVAFDRTGKVIMRPRSANNEAKYDERYFFWAGPFKTDEEVRTGKGLLVDYSQVDGTKATYPSKKKLSRFTQNSQ
jgi:hypothetical protein